MNDLNRTGIPLSDAELDDVLAAAGKELAAEVRRTTDTAMHRDEILKARPHPAGQDAGPAIHDLAEETPKRGIRAAVGNFLIALTGADRRLLTFEVDRQRHITMGMLMLLTTSLAFYAGTTVAAMGFSAPFTHEIGYGAFFALFAFFVDRSITGYVSFAGDDEPRRKSSRWAPWPRILVAIAASFLLSEVIVLQLFATRINQQVEVSHTAALYSASRQVSSIYQEQIASQQGRVNAAENRVSTAQAQLDADQRAYACELTGCQNGTGSGMAGNGPLANLYKARVNSDETNLASLQQQANIVNARAQGMINSLQSQENAQLRSQIAAVNSSNDMLAREQALQQISSSDETVLLLRIILWFLLVGIDLTPVIIKVTTSSGVYEERVRSQMLIATRNTHEIDRRRLARLKMETEVDLQNQKLDRDIAQAELEKKTRDLVSILTSSPAAPEPPLTQRQSRESEVLPTPSSAWGWHYFAARRSFGSPGPTGPTGSRSTRPRAS
jgi:hypothetical protein